MNKDEEHSSASNDLPSNQLPTLSSVPNFRKHKMSDTHWDVNGDGKRIFAWQLSINVPNTT
jgi:hypothetical protein